LARRRGSPRWRAPGSRVAHPGGQRDTATPERVRGASFHGWPVAAHISNCHERLSRKCCKNSTARRSGRVVEGDSLENAKPACHSPGRVMGPRLAKVMGPGDGHRRTEGSHATDRPPGRARRAPAGARRECWGHRRRVAALVRGWTGTFLTGAEGGGDRLSMLGLSRDR
jgi:hypothetical protein